MKCKTLLQKWIPGSLGLAFLMLSVMSMDAFALSGKLGNGGKVDLDTTLNYGASWRVQDADSDLLGSTGNRNFDKGDLVNSAFSVGMDLAAKWENYGFFLRGRGLYDTVYANDSKYPSKTQDRHGKDVELLDAFVFTDFDVAERPATFRIGRQSVSWGEGLFIGNSISTAQSPLDLTKGNAPGVELKDQFLPVGQVYSQISSADYKVTLAAYYKWEWEAARMDENGSFFSTADYLDEAGTQVHHALHIDFVFVLAGRIDFGKPLLGSRDTLSLDHGAASPGRDRPGIGRRCALTGRLHIDRNREQLGATQADS